VDGALFALFILAWLRLFRWMTAAPASCSKSKLATRNLWLSRRQASYITSRSALANLLTTVILLITVPQALGLCQYALHPLRQPRAYSIQPRPRTFSCLYAQAVGEGLDNRTLSYDEWSNEGPAVMLDEGDYLLLYRAELQEQYRQSILKRKPRFLPYKECAKWVQAMNLWDTQEEWDQWIANGEKRNPYIPSRPDEYYGKFGKWRGWHFFLHGKMDNIDESQPQQDS